MTTTTTTKALDLGTTMAGKYRLDALLGSGGMGFVYRAFHVLLERDVALKVLRPEFAVSEESTARFLAEARAANTVRHPHVVDVLDVDVDASGVPFIVQEFLQGETLASRLEAQGRLSIVDTLDLLTPIAAALAHAHARSIVHRDIKPENIFLSEAQGGLVPKLLDFGIAQSLREEFQSDDVIAGTPAYMAPELVIDPEERDLRSDLWSLGVVLFECLTGRLPFDGATPSAMFSAICHDEPRAISQLRPDLPAELSSLVQKCLARDIEQRFDSGRALLTALETVRAQLHAKPTGRVRWHSTLAPGTLRAPQALLERAQREPELVVTSDDVASVADGKRTTAATPSPITAAAVAPAPRAPSGLGPSEPPAKILSVKPAARAKLPARATVALALALAALAALPLLFSQRRSQSGRAATMPVVASADPSTPPRAAVRAPVAAPPVVVHATALPAPIAQPTITAIVDAPDAAASVVDRRRAPRARGIAGPRAREGRDASTASAPLIQLRDER
jgi:eukaryotic-like serine/threonine-protein kinase